MSDLHALIRACKAEPEDDAPRLILADWLDEHGEEERATFIRRQIREPSLNAEQLLPKSEWMGAWKLLADEWAREYKDWPYPIQFRRGFMRILDPYRELYDNLDRILRPPFDWMWVEEIRFGSWHDGDWTPLIESQNLLQLTSLAFDDDHYESKLLLPLSQCPYLSNLRSFWTLMVRQGDEGLERMSENLSLKNLRSLSIEFSNISRKGIQAFVNSAVWDRVTRCSFRVNQMNDSALDELTRGRVKAELQILDICHGQYTDAGLVKLSRSDRFPSLRELHVGFSVHPGKDSPTFGALGIESLLFSTQLGFQSLIVSINSDRSLSPEIERLAEQFPKRLSVNYLDTRVEIGL